MHTFLKIAQSMVYVVLVIGSFYEELLFRDYICNINQEPQDLQIFNCACGFIGKSAVVKYHQFLSKVQCIDEKLRFDQLATASSSTAS